MSVELPDAEALVVAYLSARLAVDRPGVGVSTRVPAALPDWHVRVWRTGGAASSRVLDEAQITCEAFGPDTTAASWLARRVQHHLLAAASVSAIGLARRVTTVGGPYYDPDPTSGRERYSLTVQVVVRGRRA